MLKNISIITIIVFLLLTLLMILIMNVVIKRLPETHTGLKEYYTRCKISKGSNREYFKGYPHTGQYKKDLEKVKKIAIDHIKKHNTKTNRPLAVVFDMDDTLVYTNNVHNVFPSYLDSPPTEPIFLFPPMEEIADIARYAAHDKIKVIIITARPPKSEKATWYNSSYYGIPVHEVYCDYSRGMNPQFKKELRKELATQYNILLTMGDRWNDVVDPGTALGIKLPSPDDTNVYLLN